jgi:hypothetical protein
VDRTRQVLRLKVEMSIPANEYEEAEKILRELKGTEATHGRVGVLQLDRSGLELDTQNIEDVFDDLPDVLRITAQRLKEMDSGDKAEVAKRALMHLYRTARKAS